jgi:hypothetical protein
MLPDIAARSKQPEVERELRLGAEEVERQGWQRTVRRSEWWLKVKGSGEVNCEFGKQLQ